MSNLVSCFMALSLLVTQGMSGGTTAPATDAASVVYHFQNDRFLLSSVDLAIDLDGRGKLVFVRKGLAKPVERDVRVSDAVLRDLDTMLERLRFLDSAETYQTPQDHSNLGEVTITVARGGARRAVEFNYTTNRDMAAVQALLRGIATREIYAFDLETAARFQPLEIPKLLEALGTEIGLGNITDPGALVPLLRQMSDDVALPLIARNRAGTLADRVDAGVRK